MARQVNTKATSVRPANNLPPLPPDTTGQVYTVQAGDTLSTISRRFGVSVTDIQRANQLSGSTIRVGQNLFIPDKR
jgi:LysM repeat protein